VPTGRAGVTRFLACAKSWLFAEEGRRVRDSRVARSLRRARATGSRACKAHRKILALFGDTTLRYPRYSGIFSDDLAVLPNVDRCAETTRGSAGIQSSLLKSASHALCKFPVSRSSIHVLAGPLSISFAILPEF
jgi:hypothetical protein